MNWPVDCLPGLQARNCSFSSPQAHIVRLVDDLMDISRVMRGKIRLRLEPVEISSAVHHAVEEAKPSLQAQQQKFVLALPTDPLWGLADPNRLSQVVSNLLTNSAKYTNRGGMVSLTVETDGKAALVIVRDDGIPGRSVLSSQAQSLGRGAAHVSLPLAEL